MKIGVALGCGGAKGIAHIAYLKAIEELGIPIDTMAGCSMGAFIGAFYAGGMPADQIRSIFTDFSLFDLPKVVGLGRPHAGLIKGERIEKFLREHLPVQRFEDLEIPMKIVATDYRNQREYVFDTGEIAPAIRASISIPGLFTPYTCNGTIFVDGGLVNPVPFDLLGDVDIVVAIDVIGNQFHENEGEIGMVDVLFGSFHIMKKMLMDQKNHREMIDIYCTPDMRKFKSLGFHKSKQILQSVRDDVQEFKATLVNMAYR